MKIGIITNLYPPYARGGAENVIVRTVEQLLSMGHDVFLITGQPKTAGLGPTLGRASVERVYRFFPWNLYFTLHDDQQPWVKRFVWHAIDALSSSGARAVRQVLADEKPDVVITHNLKGIGLTIPRAIQTMGFPHIHILHDVQLVTPSGLRMFGEESEPWYARPAYAAYRALCRYRVGAPDLVISPSQFLIDTYRNAGFFLHSDVRRLPNPSPRFSGVVREPHHGGPLRLLFIGQLHHHKGVDFLLDAFARYQGDASLQIVGTGPLRVDVEARAKVDKRISYLGYTPQEEVMNCVAAADAVVVPSLCYENSPTVIYEALAAGVPLLASRIGGVGELIRDGETGFLFTPGDKDDFLRVLTIMHRERDAFATRSGLLRQSVAPYSLPLYAEHLIAACTEVIGKKH
jgi:glycosyltransferase involved in cell wall biosynthesis